MVLAMPFLNGRDFDAATVFAAADAEGDEDGTVFATTGLKGVERTVGLRVEAAPAMVAAAVVAVVVVVVVGGIVVSMSPGNRPFLLSSNGCRNMSVQSHTHAHTSRVRELSLEEVAHGDGCCAVLCLEEATLDPGRRYKYIGAGCRGGRASAARVGGAGVRTVRRLAISGQLMCTTPGRRPEQAVSPRLASRTAGEWHGWMNGQMDLCHMSKECFEMLAYSCAKQLRLTTAGETVYALRTTTRPVPPRLTLTTWSPVSRCCPSRRSTASRYRRASIPVS